MSRVKLFHKFQYKYKHKPNLRSVLTTVEHISPWVQLITCTFKYKFTFSHSEPHLTTSYIHTVTSKHKVKHIDYKFGFSHIHFNTTSLSHFTDEFNIIKFFINSEKNLMCSETTTYVDKLIDNSIIRCVRS